MSKSSHLIDVVCTYCGTTFKRYLSATINPKTGKPRKIIKCLGCRKTKPEVRFWRMVDKTTSPSGCWLWTGGLNADGYPNFPWPEINEWRGNRVSWFLAHGKIPVRIYVLHKCPGTHNRLCVNPKHLYLGNQSDNMNDAIAQGTYVHHKGENHYAALVNEAAVLDIRANYHYGTGKLLAAKYGISVATVRDIAKRRSWKHVL